MNKVFRFSAFLTILFFGMVAGCDTQQQATPDNKSRVELGHDNNEATFGDYIVHVNVLTTDQLPPNVASEYRITRSKSRAMLNVVVAKMVNGERTPVKASVNTLTRNLANQIKNMDMREIVTRDDNHEAIYYIGDVPVDHQEVLVFNIDVTPENETGEFNLAYKEQFFTQ